MHRLRLRSSYLPRQLIHICCYCLIAIVLLAATSLFTLLVKLESLTVITVEDDSIPPQCACVDSSGRTIDLCYHSPLNRSIFGKRFSCAHLKYLLDLQLLFQNDYVDLSKEDMPDPVMVTAASENHWPEMRRMLATVRKHFPQQKVVIYDLGFEPSTVQFIKTLCHVEYRNFDFDNFPPAFRFLNQFRWKPIIIARCLKEFGAIWYMDTSAVWKKSDLSHVYQLIRCRTDRHKQWKAPLFADIAKRDNREDESEHESGFHIDRWDRAVSKCDKFAYLLHGFTGHGIFPATHPHTYDYFPTDMSEIKKPKAKMFEAGFIFAVYTREVMELVVKWYVACALEDDCMAPANAGLFCSFVGADRYEKYAGCHRFDQSVVNLLLANANVYDRYYYTSEIVDFFNIVRGGQSVEDSALQCEPQ